MFEGEYILSSEDKDVHLNFLKLVHTIVEGRIIQELPMFKEEEYEEANRGEVSIKITKMISFMKLGRLLI